MELALVAKRDNEEPDSEGTSASLDPILRTIVGVAEDNVLKKKLQKPPTWLVVADEVSTPEPPFDTQRTTRVFFGAWQGAQVAVKKFDTTGENSIFDKHFTVWRTVLHPHVAQLYGAGSDNGVSFFVYEYAAHKSLDLHWNQLSLWKLLHQAALALSYLHAKTVVHGNLGRYKLLVTATGNVKLFGFDASYFYQ